jgi:hypothetical protein
VQLGDGLVAGRAAGPPELRCRRRLVGGLLTVAAGIVTGSRGQVRDLPVQAVEGSQRLGVAGRGALELGDQRGHRGDAVGQVAGFTGLALVEGGQLLCDAGELEQHGGHAVGFTGHGRLHG